MNPVVIGVIAGMWCGLIFQLGYLLGRKSQ
jgi:hypothetical protein